MPVNLVITDVQWEPVPLRVGIQSQSVVTITNQGDEVFVSGGPPSRIFTLIVSDGYNDSAFAAPSITLDPNQTIAIPGPRYTPIAPGLNTYQLQVFSTTFDGEVNVFGLPDLIIEKINIYPLFPSVGDSVNISAIVGNIGTSSSPETPHNIQFDIDDDLIAISSLYVNSIAVGGSARVNADHAWKPITEGIFNLTAKVNGNSSILESNENNNTIARLIGVLPEYVRRRKSE